MTIILMAIDEYSIVDIGGFILMVIGEYSIVDINGY